MLLQPTADKMTKIEKIQVPMYYQGKQEGTYPRMTRRYSNPNNPTFKSDLFSLAFTHTDMIKPAPKVAALNTSPEKPKQIPKKTTLQHLDIATQQFDMRRSPPPPRISAREMALLTNDFSGRRTPRMKLNIEEMRALQSETLKQTKTRSSLGRYNDASVYSWQSKPYNIISNFAKEVDILRAPREGNPESPYGRRFFK